MALHLTPEEHDANPPHTWEVVRHGNRWQLQERGNTLEAFTTRKAAVAAKSSGFLFDLYQKEGRWFAGEAVPGWKPYTRRG